MTKFIQFLFGKPYRKGKTFGSRILRLMYWGMVVYYFLVLGLLLVNTIFNMDAIFALFVAIIFFPVSFRLIYFLIGANLDYKKGRWMMPIGAKSYRGQAIRRQMHRTSQNMKR
ncbi:hypothetical protein [Aquibacillus rhizosphaerae]|uniref:DUF4133 domain-containing protein n=1 Tax=Aquibacillus rhizosphaerae TaxID=3051431 RepID=A0ABT7L8F1_9BACI|nr:hypothetical protein [Aquibacillus sp. LR5S19]MDL4842138.1 hypothetical protein [Aquibacillus sp. LR5S19]